MIKAEQIELSHLPPYSPELNQDEYLNCNLKATCILEDPPVRKHS